jgi:hypothetical protein
MHDEGALHGMQPLGRTQPLNGSDRFALVHDGKGQATVDPAPLDDHRAGAALAMVAALLGAGEVQMLAQRIQQGGARVELQMHVAPIHLHVERHHAIALLRRCGPGGRSSLCQAGYRSGRHGAALQDVAARKTIGRHG